MKSLPRTRFIANIPPNVSQVCTWQLGKVPPDKAPCLSGKVTLEAGFDYPQDYPSMLLGWRLVGTALSGTRVRFCSNAPVRFLHCCRFSRLLQAVSMGGCIHVGPLRSGGCLKSHQLFSVAVLLKPGANVVYCLSTSYHVKVLRGLQKLDRRAD